MKTQIHLAIALLASTALVAPINAIAQSAEDEVISVGTLIKRKPQADRSSPVETISDVAIGSTGAKSIADLTQTLTINTGAENNPDAFTQSGTTGTTNINLRGLGVQSTLVLLNGRRQVLSAATTNGGFNFVDTSSLVPLIAVKNVEILKDGASATYGSDAVAGVANFTTFDNFDGIKLNAQYQTVSGTGDSDEIVLQGMLGKNFDRGNVMAAVSYTDRTALTTTEKRLSRPQDDTSALGNPGAYVPLPGGPIPAGFPLIDPGCEAAGGFAQVLAPGSALGIPLDVGTCGFDFGGFFNLIPEETRLNALVSANYDLTDTISWTGEFSYADNEAIRGNSPSFPFLLGGFVLPNHPNNLFAGPLAPLAPNGSVFLGRASGNGGVVSPNLTTSETWRFSTALDGQFGDNMDWRLSYTQGENNHIINTEDTVSDRFRCSLLGNAIDDATAGALGVRDVNPATGQLELGCDNVVAQGATVGEFFNPFATSFTTAPNSQALLDFVIGTQMRDLTSTLQVIEGVVSRDLGDSGAAIAIGAQYRKEEYDAVFDAQSNADNFGFLIGEQDYSGEQDVYAVFGELAIPVSETFDIQAALRYEDYGGAIGSTFDPKVAFLFRPVDYLSVRGSFSTSFRAPTVFQQFGQGTSLNQVSDPTRGGANTFAATRALGNPNLSPEQSEAFNIGVSVEPVSDLKLDLDIYRFNFTDVIIAQNFQAVVNADPLNPVSVVRNAGGSIVQVNTNYVNASSVETSGVDFGLKYTIDSDIGMIVPFIQGTYVFAYDLDDPQAGSVSGAGNRNFANFGTSVPQLRFNTGFNWIKDNHRLDVFGRHIGGYTDDQNAGIDIDSHFTVDARYSLGLSEFFSGFGEGTALTVGVINAFNEDPPQVFTNGGFDSKVHDPRGRLLYVGVDVEF
jgi:iron complex outermembrane receptor protein